MAKITKESGPSLKRKTSAKISRPTRTIEAAGKGLRTDQDFINLLSAGIRDTVEGYLTAGSLNAIANSCGKVLGMIELKYKYGTVQGKRRSLLLAEPVD